MVPPLALGCSSAASFHPPLTHWTDLENINHWELPDAEQADSPKELERGYLDADYHPGGGGEVELNWLSDHIWRVAARDGGWFTMELAGFLDGQRHRGKSRC